MQPPLLGAPSTTESKYIGRATTESLASVVICDRESCSFCVQTVSADSDGLEDGIDVGQNDGFAVGIGDGRFVRVTPTISGDEVVGMLVEGIEVGCDDG